jgi:hypothetical protein
MLGFANGWVGFVQLSPRNTNDRKVAAPSEVRICAGGQHLDHR